MDYESDILAIVGAVHDLTGLHVVWKDADGRGVSQEIYQHNNAFCTCIKARAAALGRCLDDDNFSVAERAATSAEPFIKRCHAGVSELVVPLHEGGRFSGALFVGPFREGAICPYARARSLFDELPAFDPTVVDAVRKLLKPVSSYVENAKQVTEMSELAKPDLDSRIATAVDRIRREFHQPLSATELAGEVGLSASRFVHLFREQTGMSFSACLTDLRNQHAKKLLRNTKLPIGQVAEECGYRCQNYFANAFRKLNACSPKQFRRRVQSDLGA